MIIELLMKKIRATLVAKAEQLAKLYSRPIYIFRELLNYLEQQKIVLLGYSIMQKHIIAQALIRERLRLETLADQLLNQGSHRAVTVFIGRKSSRKLSIDLATTRAKFLQMLSDARASTPQTANGKDIPTCSTTDSKTGNIQ